ncbi:N-acetylmuramoyl-L-alanine amidase CwlD [Bacillus sp. CGMCC 1.16607]|uniref:N-acetylmuramoyl-L-alanine amidase CwlD n=1 Tax=Bacillus sp. CGMCC 1.16607 TaxID=3351842 RepID=UPI003630125A
MKRKLNIGIFAVGLILLLIILQFDFMDDDSWNSWNLPLSGKIILVDPGHGAPDPGAGPKDAYEKDIALSVSLKLKDYLQEQGALVMMTRETDTDLADPGLKGYSKRKVQDLKRRLEMINDSQIDFFLSIHLNAIPEPQWRGAQIFYAPQYIENKRAAKFIQDEFRRNLENTDRKAKPSNSIYLLRNADKPGVLVEIGFLSNPEEKENLKSDKYQDQVAASIYNGILRYFSNENKRD